MVVRNGINADDDHCAQRLQQTFTRNEVLRHCVKPSHRDVGEGGEARGKELGPAPPTSEPSAHDYADANTEADAEYCTVTVRVIVRHSHVFAVIVADSFRLLLNDQHGKTAHTFTLDRDEPIGPDARTVLFAALNSLALERYGCKSLPLSIAASSSSNTDPQ
jgi:hypothetical protein